MGLARLDSPKTEDPVGRPKRYRLVTSRVEDRGIRMRRFRLMQTDPLPRLDPVMRGSRAAQ